MQMNTFFCGKCFKLQPYMKEIINLWLSLCVLWKIMHLRGSYTSASPNTPYTSFIIFHRIKKWGAMATLLDIMRSRALWKACGMCLMIIFKHTVCAHHLSVISARLKPPDESPLRVYFDTTCQNVMGVNWSNLLRVPSASSCTLYSI